MLQEVVAWLTVARDPLMALVALFAVLGIIWKSRGLPFVVWRCCWRCVHLMSAHYHRMKARYLLYRKRKKNPLTDAEYRELDFICSGSPPLYAGEIANKPELLKLLSLGYAQNRVVYLEGARSVMPTLDGLDVIKRWRERGYLDG